MITDGRLSLFAGSRDLTTFHAEYAGIPRNWVHVVFQDYAHGSGFTAGEVSATPALTLLIRTGRSPDYKSGLLKRLWELFQDAAGAPDDQTAGTYLSANRICETRLRHATGRSYESFVYLLEELSRPAASLPEVQAAFSAEKPEVVTTTGRTLRVPYRGGNGSGEHPVSRRARGELPRLATENGRV